ncbi:hypothetical protein [Mycobacteroides abscessus]|uniref:hypothetical protein n=1 Tax=Mycobacteroides abscessus TaxID=36809 RepID=UPI00192847A9|nr:hypothetical protein [Mycobacteroides abscessus]MBL3752923.1 hypothetical protein [Mycobacteroides abscessus subsp. massiliense]
MSEDRPRKCKRYKEPRENKYAELPPPIDLLKTVASVNVSAAEVEQAGNPEWNAGADPYLRIVGWKRP